MIDAELFKILVPFGTGGMLAALIFGFYRKDSLGWQESWKGQQQILIQVVKENTAAMAKLESLIEAMEFDQRGRR